MKKLTKSWRKILYIVFLSLGLMVVAMSGCITDVPFQLRTDTISLIVDPPIGIYGETMVWVPAEAREKGVKIDETQLVYRVVNLSNVPVEAKIYLSLEKNANTTGKLVFHKKLGPYESIDDVLNEDIITQAMQTDHFFLGAELSNSVQLAVSGYLDIKGQYNVLDKIY
jgi:hypothetical protein